MSSFDITHDMFEDIHKYMEKENKDFKGDKGVDYSFVHTKHIKQKIQEAQKELKEELKQRIDIYQKAIEKTDNKDMEINYGALAEQLKTIIKIMNRVFLKHFGEGMLKDEFTFEGKKYRVENHKATEIKIDNPVCSLCGKEMKNAVDSITKKISPYLWECDCEESKNMRLSRG